MADLGEGIGGSGSSPHFELKKKKSQKEEKPAGHAKQNWPPPPAPLLSSRSGLVPPPGQVKTFLLKKYTLARKQAFI